MPATLLSLKTIAAFVIAALLAACSGTPSRQDLSAARQEVVLHAIAQIGTPYRFGGESPGEGFDCSQAMSYYRYIEIILGKRHLSAGISVPRVTKAQKKAARGVRRTSAQPGDLVFFHTGWRRYHVGILVDDGRFVHAPSNGKKVQITRLDNPYWRKRLSGTWTFLN